MKAFNLQRVDLPTGVSLDVAVEGDPANPPVILLHGFPESHRTWRDIIPDLARDHHVIAPDQRGYARSSKPEGVAKYAPQEILADLIALADHFGIGKFTLVGHDWGGAIAWMAAILRPDRVERLVILNAPHPVVFQQTLITDKDQRAASQYMRAFRSEGFENAIDARGMLSFFERNFAAHIPVPIPEEEKAIYLDQWTQPGALSAMLNWYRASSIEVPPVEAEIDKPTFPIPELPPIAMPTLVVWGMKDPALLPCQLDGLEAHVRDLTIVRVAEAGHFIPWERPDAVIAALRGWFAEQPAPAGA
ncbi:alpha/beta fold hydrolase [Stakelama tenebrarum]|uniref:Alpha/beta hydrolase n=1 Tax=Stakelama tenebrarum TaxID=2711215 RepID=A0A6G6Y2K8_9SPHN|nr:alpha/beta hydrolase [Sphingosinithalassobacter tenebrarum]QIG79184.1 alpha/beta hydrolase [Sphingosinithalassobacter tenebrarum]